jgi:hypothetical protein
MTKYLIYLALAQCVYHWVKANIFLCHFPFRRKNPRAIMMGLKLFYFFFFPFSLIPFPSAKADGNDDGRNVMGFT